MGFKLETVKCIYRKSDTISMSIAILRGRNVANHLSKGKRYLLVIYIVNTDIAKG